MADGTLLRPGALSLRQQALSHSVMGKAYDQVSLAVEQKVGPVTAGWDAYLLTRALAGTSQRLTEVKHS